MAISDCQWSDATSSVSSTARQTFNVRDVSAGKIADNEEITNIKILGLKTTSATLPWTNYATESHGTRPGRRRLAQLLINVFSSLWPSLFPSTFVDDGHTHRQGEEDAQSTHSIIHSTRSGGRIMARNRDGLS
jgi:hypothetical protein